jgi:methionine-rich copper-binding protein CopC
VPFSFTRTRSSRRVGMAAAIAAVAAVLMLAPSPASAHDDLLGSDPEDGVVLETAPAQVELRYSAEPLDEPGGTIVRVVDPEGAEVQQGEPEVVDNAVIQAIAADAAVVGTYTVTWRVVSSDGHAISGELLFSVGEESEPADAPSEGPIPEDGVPTAVVALWIIGGVVAIGVMGAVVAVLVAISRRRGSED